MEFATDSVCEPLWTTHVYVRGEVRQFFYSSAAFPGQVNELKPAGTFGLLGLGYQFQTEWWPVMGELS